MTDPLSTARREGAREALTKLSEKCWRGEMRRRYGDSADVRFFAAYNEVKEFRDEHYPALPTAPSVPLPMTDPNDVPTVTERQARERERQAVQEYEEVRRHTFRLMPDFLAKRFPSLPSAVVPYTVAIDGVVWTYEPADVWGIEDANGVLVSQTWSLFELNLEATEAGLTLDEWRAKVLRGYDEHNPDAPHRWVPLYRRAALSGEGTGGAVETHDWQRTLLRSALQNYGRHHGWCLLHEAKAGELPPVCNCGLAELIAAPNHFMSKEWCMEMARAEGEQEVGAGRAAVPPEGSEERRDAERLVARITEYLASGGLFNPELMEHEKVRDLLVECRDHLATRSPSSAPSETHK